jgi:hypothetical protein
MPWNIYQGFRVPVLNQVKMIDFARFSYFVPELKQVKKMEKKSKKKSFLDRLSGS